MRDLPYINKPSEHVISLMEIANDLTFFLVSESGPTSFTIKDSEGKKFKVSIGPKVSCSCKPKKNEHCVHTIFTFMKIFKVPCDNPIMW